MSYLNRPTDDFSPEPIATGHPVVNQVVDYHDRIRWGPILSGLVVALASQIMLSALGAAIGSGFLSDSGAPRSNAGGVGTSVGIWSIVSLFISLFFAGWITAHACGPMKRSTALLNGTILWATTLALSSWLLASGVSGAFGVIASNTGAVINQVQQQGGVNIPQNAPNVSADQARAVAEGASRGFWWFFFGSLLGLIASLIGAATGARSPRINHS